MLRSITKGALACAALALTGLAAVPATAQPKDISIPADTDWEHDWSALTFPAKIGTFERTQISQFEDRETNIAGNYFEESTGTYLTIYIYRPGNPVSPIWFDRALTAIGFRGENYGDVDVDEASIGSFVPAGGSAESGQMAVTKVDGRFSSTAVAMYQAGEWLVKLRISSQKLNVGELDRLTKDTLAGLPKMADVSEQPAYFVTQCAAVLAQLGNGEVYEPEADKGASGLLLGLMLSQIATGAPSEVESEQAKFCREGEREPRLNIFRTEEPGSGYIVALGDAGQSIEVMPVGGLDAATSLGAPKDLHAIRSSTGLETDYYTPFTGLPNLSQVGRAFNSQPIARTTRPIGDEESKVQIFASPSAASE